MSTRPDKNSKRKGRHTLPILSQADIDLLNEKIREVYGGVRKTFYLELAAKLKSNPGSVQRLVERVVKGDQGFTHSYLVAIREILKLTPEQFPSQPIKKERSGTAQAVDRAKHFSFLEICQQLPDRPENRESHCENQLRVHCEQFLGAGAFPPERILTVAVEVPSGQSRMIKAQLLTFPLVESPVEIFIRDPSNSWHGQKSSFFHTTDSGTSPIPVGRQRKGGGVRISLVKGQNHVLILAAYGRSLLEPTKDSLFDIYTFERRTEFAIRVLPFTARKPITSIFVAIAPYKIEIAECYEFVLDKNELCFAKKTLDTSQEAHESFEKLSELLGTLVADAKAHAPGECTSSIVCKDDFLNEHYGSAFDVLIHRTYKSTPKLYCASDQTNASNNLFYIISGER